MKRIAMLMVCAVLLAVCGVVTQQSARAAEAKVANPTYVVQITLQQALNGQEQTLAAQQVSVLEKTPGTVWIRNEQDNIEYRFDFIVKRDEQVGMIATTTGSVTQNGKELISPSLTQRVGQEAVIKTGDYTMKVKVDLAD